MESQPEEQGSHKRFRIQRRRLGKIMHSHEDGSFGFIDGEDFRDDVFFHIDSWNGTVTEDGVSRKLDPELGLWVEFELADDHLAAEGRLRAKVVRPTNRPDHQRQRRPPATALR